MFKKLLLLLLFISVISLPVQAHVTEISGDFLWSIHIDPDDKPVAMEKAIIYLTEEKVPAQFSLEECDCILTISNDNGLYESIPLKRLTKE
jgi:hypothetical protein